MRPFLALTLAVLSGCCSLKSYEDMRERAQAAEKALEEQHRFLAGCHDDISMLQKFGIEQQSELRSWQAGSMLQALEMERLLQACSV